MLLYLSELCAHLEKQVLVVDLSRERDLKEYLPDVAENVWLWQKGLVDYCIHEDNQGWMQIEKQYRFLFFYVPDMVPEEAESFLPQKSRIYVVSNGRKKDLKRSLLWFAYGAEKLILKDIYADREVEQWLHVRLPDKAVNRILCLCHDCCDEACAQKAAFSSEKVAKRLSYAYKKVLRELVFDIFESTGRIISEKQYKKAYRLFRKGVIR